MTLCLIANSVGCRKCPVFKVCPVKGLIGNLRDTPAAPEKPKAAAKKTNAAKKRP